MMLLQEIDEQLDIKRAQKEDLIVEIKELTQQKNEIMAQEMAAKLAASITPEQRAAIIQVLNG